LIFLSSAQAQETSQEEKDRKLVESCQSKITKVIENSSKAYLCIDGGSSVIISPLGEVLTNHHVVINRKVGESWYVMDSEKKIHQIQLLAIDSWGDLAYLKLSANRSYPFVPLAISYTTKVGDPVIALGNPFSLAIDGKPSASLGIISALELQEYNYSVATQTDTAINPGNSGGPLINLNGELVGINGKITPRFFKGMNSGVGFAIPVEQIRRLLPALRKGGEIHHGNIDGIVFEADLVQRRIQSITAGSSAEKAGLKISDELVSVNERKVRHQTHFWGLVQSYPEGANITLQVNRHGSLLNISVTLDKYMSPELEPSSQKSPFLGVRLGDASVFKEKPALPIEEVAPDSPAEKAGLQNGDLILSVDGKNFSSAKEFGKYIRGKKVDSEITLVLKREKKIFSVNVRLGSL
jgi:S1-C subfamily serine protease